jgi:LemA protein
MNKKGQSGVLVGAIVVIVVMLFIVMIIAGMYNSLVQVDVSTGKAWGNVQTAYQRRADLIPNLVATVQGAKTFEQQTQTQIAALRSQAGQVQQQVQTATTPGELQTAANDMSGIVSRLLVIVEAYPDLKSNQNFLALQDELAGTENRIKYERDNYNTAAQSYQLAVRSFPTNILAGMFGFSVDKWRMFQADASAQTAPKVNFT